MESSKEKSFRRIRKSYSWLSVISAILSFLISVGLVNGALLFFALYSVNSMVDNQSEIIEHMSNIYEESTNHSSDALRDVLVKECPDFFVLDINGKELDSHGKNTYSSTGGHLGSLFGHNDYLVYEDTEEKLLLYADGGLVIPDPNPLYHQIKTQLHADDPEDDDSLEDAGARKIVDMPIWIETGLSKGDRFIAKGHVQIQLPDLFIFFITFICLNAFTLFFLAIRLINLIRGFIKRKQMTELFLVDDVTKGNNWMAFLLKGERILKKRRNARKHYAMIHLVIVEYRNYCMCHSLEEGQKLLFRISHVIEKNLSKKELSAHVSSSSFVLLIEAENDDAVKERFNQLLKELKNLNIPQDMQQPGHSDTFHLFHFQAGVQIIEPIIINGKTVKRKDAKIEYYYNNAVTAKSTLGTTDNDGIAFFDSKLMEEERWVETVKEHQQKALDNEEFAVYYQPKYSPDNSELIGAEALIRWQSPDFGFVPPGRFIPIFEKNGFITNIDHYMICHVAKDQKKWLDAGMRCVPVSVNVSRAHFAESDLAEQILNMIDSIGTPHNLIEIELTESAFFDDKNAIIETINRLKSYGFSVSMDDFGSGYSSLNSLKDMDLDVLKLDAEFFRGDADPDRKEVVVSEAIQLAKRLNMRTVAEGVEEKDQVDFLKQQGCDMIQGYYFAKPMPKEEYEERMKEIYHIPDRDK